MVERPGAFARRTARRAEPGWVADALADALGVSVHVRPLGQRTELDLFAAESGVGAMVVKVGPPARLEREAANLRRAAVVVGDLAPRLVALVSPAGGPAVLAMSRVSGAHVAPGGLSPAAWGRLTRGLFRLHAQIGPGPAVCVPLRRHFMTLGPIEDRRVSLADLRALLARAVDGRRCLEAALGVLDALVAVIQDDPRAFELRPRLVHADLWPENVLVRGRTCWLVDWAWLQDSDYALDLANLKLLLDWVWSPWLAQVVFERLVRRYMLAFGDPGLSARLAVYLPLVSLVHLIQYAEGGAEDPDNAAAMHACLATARRDREVWAQPSLIRRVVAAFGRRPGQSEYADAPRVPLPGSGRKRPQE